MPTAHIRVGPESTSIYTRVAVERLRATNAPSNSRRGAKTCGNAARHRAPCPSQRTLQLWGAWLDSTLPIPYGQESGLKTERKPLN
jgi:hypothetical protein